MKEMLKISLTSLRQSAILKTRGKSPLTIGEKRMSTKTTTKTGGLSDTARELEKAFSIIAEKTGAPRAVIVIGRDSKKHGHFTPWTPWQDGQEEGEKFHEIFLSAPSFSRGARATLGTLLHETAHAINTQAGIQDTGKEGRHNKEFKKTAESLGLEITQSEKKSLGLSETAVPDSCVERWQDVLAIIEKALSLVAVNDTAGAPKGRDKNLKVAQCPECEEKIRLSLKTFEACAPWCSTCSRPFRLSLIDLAGSFAKGK